MKRFIMAAGAVLCLCAAAGMAQAKSVESAEIRKLQQDVQQLQAQQQQILVRLDELKQLLTRGNEPQGPRIPATLSVAGETYRGEPRAQLAIIEYADFECPFCRRFHKETYPQIGAAYVQTGKLKYFYRDLPLPFHSHALPAARAARCAEEQGKFWQMHDDLFQQEALGIDDIKGRAGGLGLNVTQLSQCLDSDRFAGSIQQSMNDAAQMRINGTPTFVIGTVDENGAVMNVKGTVVGAQPFAAFQAAIEPLLRPAAATAGGN